ncbi:MAG: hypothetical protein ACKODK_09880 [Opitutaceae bacterium]
MSTAPNPPEPAPNSSSSNEETPVQPTPNLLQQAWDQMTKEGSYLDAEPESWGRSKNDGRTTVEITFHRAPRPSRRRASTAKKPRRLG